MLKGIYWHGCSESETCLKGNTDMVAVKVKVKVKHAEREDANMVAVKVKHAERKILTWLQW